MEIKYKDSIISTVERFTKDMYFSKPAKKKSKTYREIFSFDNNSLYQMIPITDLKIGIRAKNVLTENGIVNMEQLLESSEERILSMHGAGHKVLFDIYRELNKEVFEEE